ncbi:MAG: hypothetical protein WA432_04200 [Candidatus Babeliaceae bacterium]
MNFDNNTYNKIKLLHELTRLNWFLEKHALNDAQMTGDQEFLVVLTKLNHNLTDNIEKMQQSVCTIMQ